jgi:hypothetical protein
MPISKLITMIQGDEINYTLLEDLNGFAVELDSVLKDCYCMQILFQFSKPSKNGTYILQQLSKTPIYS